jgi:ubiquitin fusion degradation protein 1
LDGKSLAHQSEPVSSSGSKEKRPDTANGSNAKPSAGSSSQSTNRQAQGKLVFGSNVNRAPKETEKVPVFRPL